jgi:hypothetical protein
MSDISVSSSLAIHSNRVVKMVQLVCFVGILLGMYNLLQPLDLNPIQLLPSSLTFLTLLF